MESGAPVAVPAEKPIPLLEVEALGIIVLKLREELLLVCFVAEPTGEAAVAGGDSMVEIPRVGEVES